MQFVCPRSTLAEHVAVVSHAVLSRSSNPILEGLLLTLQGDHLTLTGYDTETGIRCLLEASPGKDGQIVLPCSTFGEILRKLPDGLVELETQEDRVRISCQDAEFNILGYPAESYPLVVFPTEGQSIALSQKVLRSIITQTVFAVSGSDTKPVHTGCLFHLEGGVLNVVGVDGFRLALRREVLEQPTEEAHFVVPGKTLQEISRVIGDREIPVLLYLSGRSVVFETENMSIVTRTLEGEFLNYSQSIPKEYAIRSKVDVKQFLDCIDRAALLISEKQRSPVRIHFTSVEAFLSCSTPMGRVTDRLPIESEGGEVEMGFNNRFLQDALKNCGETTVWLEMSSSNSPLVIKPLEGDAFTFLVLPVRLRGET